MALGTQVTGNVRVDQLLAAKVPVYMDNVLHMSERNKARFEFLTSQFRGIESCTNRKVEYLEQRPTPMVMKVTGAEAIGQTTPAVDHPEYAHLDQLIYNVNKDEWVILQEETGGTTAAGQLTIVGITGSGGITKAWEADDVLIIGPEAHAEGEALPAAFSQAAVSLYSYIMQSDRTRGNTDINAATAEYGEKQLVVDRIMAMIEYKRAKNMMFYIGGQSLEVVSAGGPRRYAMKGLKDFISTNKIDYSAVAGGLTVQALGELMRRTKNASASSETKLCLAGQNALVYFSALPDTAIRTTVQETVWGKDIKTILTPFGTVALDYDNMLSQEYGLADIMALIDPAHVWQLQLAGLPDRLIQNVQNTYDIHNVIDAITGTFGLKVVLEELHAWGYGIA